MRPTLEQLEDRLVPSVTITDHGGAILAHPEINNVFVGVASNQQAQMGGLAQVLAGPYAALLAPYGVGTGTLHSSTLLPAAVAPTNAAMQQLLASEIAANLIPPPDANSLYMVYLPQKPSDSFAVNADAYHGSFMLPGGETVAYAVMWPQAADETAGAAHEFAEASTDPVPGTGWFGVDTTQEVCDILGGQRWILDGYSVATVAGPDGTPLPGQNSPPPPSPPAPYFNVAELVALPMQEARVLVFDLLAKYNPAFAGLAQSAETELASNAMGGTAWGEVIEAQVQAAFYTALAEGGT